MLCKKLEVDKLQSKTRHAGADGVQGQRGLLRQPTLRAALQAEGVTVGRYRVRRRMREFGLKSAWRRKFVHTPDSRHELPVAANRLDR